MKYLPSKKITVIIVSVIIISGAVLWISERGREEGGSAVESVKNPKLTDGIANKDSDQDGLADWEEALWGTDPNNPDSDSDGTPDGEEVSANRDPVVKGEDDLPEKTILSEKKFLPVKSEDMTQTGAAAVELLSKYFEVKESGTFSEEDKIQIQEDFIDSFLTNLSPQQTVPKFLLKDITTIETNKSNLKKYGNAVAFIILKYEGKEDHGNPKDVLAEALESKNISKANDLKVLAQDYILAAEEISKIPTPKSALSLHLSFINNLTIMGENISLLGNVLTDPLSSLGALISYQEKVLALSNSAKDLKEYLKSNGISYTAQESGYILVNDI
jgi:hypothetical protein